MDIFLAHKYVLLQKKEEMFERYYFQISHLIFTNLPNFIFIYDKSLELLLRK